MYTKVDPNASQTLAFRKHIIYELGSRAPLSHGELIEIIVIDGHTPFPKIIENPLKDNEGNDITTLDVIEKERGILKFEGKNRSKTVEIMDEPLRACLRRNAVCDYIEHAFDPLCLVKLPFIMSDKPLTIKIPFLVKDPIKIYAEYEDPEKTLYLDGVGNLWREPKEQNLYPIGENSDRHKIVRYFAKNTGHRSVDEISIALDGKDEKLIRTEVAKIRNNITKFLHINGRSVIKTKTGSGYGVLPPYKIKTGGS